MKIKRAAIMALAFILACAPIYVSAATDEAAAPGRTVRILKPTVAFNMNDDPVAEILKNETGFDVEYGYYATNEALALEVSSGTGYDLINIYGQMYQTLLSAGALKDISGLLKKFPDIKEAIADQGWTYVTADDGGVYGIPHVDDAVYVGGIVYRTDIFDKYGYSEPATLDEFYGLLKRIKEDTGMIPLTGRTAIEPVIASAFGLSYDFVADPEKNEIVSWLRLDGMKDYLAWMHKAYMEGLIDIDWPVNSDDMISSKMSSGKSVMAYAAHWTTLSWVNALRENGNPDAYFKTIVPLEDANGKRHIAVANGVSVVTAIPVTASDEDAMRALSLVSARLKPETYWAFNDGYEGIHYTKDEKGIPTPILPKFNDDMNHGNEYQLGRHKTEHPITWMARVRKSEVQWDTFYDANKKAAAYGFEGKPLTFAQFPEYSDYYDSLASLCNEYFLQVISGTETLDHYDAFVKQWEAQGGLEMERAATEWYHAHPDLVALGSKSESPYLKLFGL